MTVTKHNFPQLNDEVAADIRKYHFGEAVMQAADAFRSKNYELYVELLEPFDDMLSGAQRKKLDYAKRNARQE